MKQRRAEAAAGKCQADLPAEQCAHRVIADGECLLNDIGGRGVERRAGETEAREQSELARGGFRRRFLFRQRGDRIASVPERRRGYREIGESERRFGAGRMVIPGIALLRGTAGVQPYQYILASAIRGFEPGLLARGRIRSAGITFLHAEKVGEERNVRAEPAVGVGRYLASPGIPFQRLLEMRALARVIPHALVDRTGETERLTILRFAERAMRFQNRDGALEPLRRAQVFIFIERARVNLLDRDEILVIAIELAGFDDDPARLGRRVSDCRSCSRQYTGQLDLRHRTPPPRSEKFLI